MKEVEATLLIADLSGYTALTEAHGDLHAAGVVSRYMEIAERILEPGTHLAERVGDELLIVAGEAGSAVRTAVREAAPARLPFQGSTYYFCSFACAKAFAERPDLYSPD